MELKKLIYTVEDGIAVIKMNYMKNLNAIDEQMADELMYVVDAAEKDPNVKGYTDLDELFADLKK